MFEERNRRRSLLGLLGMALAVAALVVGVRARVAVPPVSAAPVTVYAVTGANPAHLITFSSAAPGTILTDVAITGLLTQNVAGTDLTETLVGIDFRPATSVLYGVGFVSSSQHVYTLNTSTGVATPVSPTSFAASLAGSNFGVDFDATADVIRLISPFGLNLRLSPTTGQVVGTDTNTPTSLSGAASTAGSTCAAAGLYVIDFQTNQLGLLSTPSTGVLTVVGPLGIDAQDRVGFDIASDGTAYASVKLTIIASDPVNFYQINLTNGTATLIGAIGGTQQVTGMAVLSGPPATPTPTVPPTATPKPPPGATATPAPTPTAAPSPTPKPTP
jgi:hypothetical protein